MKNVKTFNEATKTKIDNNQKIQDIIEELELDFIEFVEANMDKRKKMLPLKNKEQIKGLIWNLLTSKKYLKRISQKDFSKILDIWFKRLD
jgi:uncharacterized protein YaaR (DUF327 family)